MAAPGGSGAGGLLGVYEDTDFELGSKLAAAARSASAAAGGSSGGLGLHEDTEFIHPAAAATAAAGGMQGLYEDSGFYCAEDTEFLTRPVGGGGLQLHEDTDLLTRPVGGGGGTQPLLSRVNRLSLANDALTKGLANLREDSDSPSPSRPQLDVCADTEFLTRPVDASGAAAGGSSMGGQQQQRPAYDDSSSTAGLQRSKENLPEDSWRQPGVLLGAAVGDENAACHHQQQPPAYGRSGPSRFAPGSVPSSPGAHAVNVHAVGRNVLLACRAGLCDCWPPHTLLCVPRCCCCCCRPQPSRHSCQHAGPAATHTW
jgi:hypothetical protein